MSSGDPVEQMSGAGLIRRVLAVAGCGVLTVTATACESTEQESAKLAGEDRQTVPSEAKLNLGAINHSVRVSDVTLLSSSGRTAVAVRLTGTSTAAQLNVPLRVNVTGAGGRCSTATMPAGLEPSLQRVGPAGARPGRVVGRRSGSDDKAATAAHVSCWYGNGPRGRRPPRR